MTQDRKTAAGSAANGSSARASTATMAAAAVLPSGAGTRSQPGQTGYDSAGRSLHWDELFLHATPAQRTELLSLARKQGLLYAHQLPIYANGKKAAPHLEDHGQLGQLANL